MRRTAVALAVVAILAVAPSCAFPAPWLLPPPVPGTLADAADRAAVATAYSADRIAQADRDRILDPFAAFSGVLGPAFVADRLPATSELLTAVLIRASAAAVEAKEAFPRLRPFASDPTFARCSGTALVGPDHSYPSGHAAIGHAWAIVLAGLVPSAAAALLARGLDYGVSRVVCGVHWPSDVAAGQALGAAVAAAMIADPRFGPLLDSARAELELAAGPPRG